MICIPASRRRHPLLGPIAILIALALAPAAAVAQSGAGVQRSLEEGAPEFANQRYRIGVQLYREGRFGEAAREFEAAFAVYPKSPKLAYNRARAWERADELDKAVESYRTYLALAPKADDRAEVEQVIGVLAERIDAQRATLTVASVPVGATVYLDAATEPAGTTPFELKVSAGSHLLSFKLDGHKAAVEQFEAKSGAREVVTANLEVADPPAAASPAPVSAEPAMTARQEAPPPVEPDSGWRTWVGWGAIATGAAALGFGVVSHLAMFDDADKAKGRPGDDAYDTLKSDFESHQLAAGLGYGLGAVLMGTGVFFVLTDDGGSQASVAPLPGGAVVTVRF